MTGCIIVAAGRGTRFKSRMPKTFFLLKDKPLLQYSLETFSKCEAIDEIVLVVQRRFLKNKYVLNWKKHFPKIKSFVAGGEFREESVLNGLKKCSNNCEVILIHDGARPFLTCNLIKRVEEAALKYGACIPVYPVNGSVKIVRNRKLAGTIYEKDVEIAQTPQGFRRDILEKIFKKYRKELNKFPDESSMCEKYGFPVHTIRGESTNIKITNRQDLKIALALLAEDH